MGGDLSRKLVWVQWPNSIKGEVERTRKKETWSERRGGGRRKKEHASHDKCKRCV